MVSPFMAFAKGVFQGYNEQRQMERQFDYDMQLRQMDLDAAKEKCYLEGEVTWFGGRVIIAFGCATQLFGPPPHTAKKRFGIARISTWSRILSNLRTLNHMHCQSFRPISQFSGAVFLP